MIGLLNAAEPLIPCSEYSPVRFAGDVAKPDNTSIKYIIDSFEIWSVGIYIFGRLYMYVTNLSIPSSANISLVLHEITHRAQIIVTKLQGSLLLSLKKRGGFFR